MEEEGCDALELAAAMLKLQVGDKSEEIQADEYAPRRSERSLGRFGRSGKTGVTDGKYNRRDNRNDRGKNRGNHGENERNRNHNKSRDNDYGTSRFKRNDRKKRQDKQANKNLL